MLSTNAFVDSHLLCLFLKKFIGKYVVIANAVIQIGGGKYVLGKEDIVAIMTVINALVDDDSSMYSNSSLFSGVCPGCLFSNFASAAKNK